MFEKVVSFNYKSTLFCQHFSLTYAEMILKINEKFKLICC